MPNELIHPQKQDWINSGGDPELKALFPELTDSEKSYLQLITSQSYEELVKRLQKYTGIEPKASNLPRIVMLTMQSLQTVTQIEGQNRKDLEQLALDFVFAMPEFEMVKEAVENGEVSIQLALKKPDIKLEVKGEQEDEEGLSPEEEMNQELAEGFGGLDPMALKKRLADLLVQGSAVRSTYAFHLVEKELSAIDKRLVNMYGILACAAQLGYWVVPEGVEAAAANSDAKVGAEQVVPEGDEYVIKVQAVCFPYLVHELVKGVYNWLTTKKEFAEVPHRGVEGETSDIIVGPEVVKAISSYIPRDKQNLTPLINKLILDLEPEEVQSVLKKDQNGQQIMKEIVRQAEDMWREYQTSKTDFEGEDEEEGWSEPEEKEEW